jgi:nicotinamidase-related amidase
MLNAENAVLVYVDIQGKLATLMYEKERLFANLVRMSRAARLLNIPIIWNEQLPDKLGETIPELKAALSDMQPLVKKAFSCCGNPAFTGQLARMGRKQILLTGIETHICVYQSAVDLVEAGYEVHVLIDAVSSRFEHNYRLGLDRMKDAGAKLSSVEMALFEMMEEAGTDTFREVVKLLK